MLKGFRNFVLRGNVVDLAVAVVIGVAFAGVIESITDHLITPLINAFGGEAGPEGLAVRVRADNPATTLNFSQAISAVLNFLIVSAVVYFLVVVPVNRLLARHRHDDARECDAVPADVALLQEIRDLLRDRPVVPPA